MNPANPVIRALALAVFKVPVTSGVSEPTERIIGGDRISTPSGHSDPEMLNIARRSGEINTIHQGINRGAYGLGDTKRYNFRDGQKGLVVAYLPVCTAGRT